MGIFCGGSKVLLSGRTIERNNCKKTYCSRIDLWLSKQLLSPLSSDLVHHPKFYFMCTMYVVALNVINVPKCSTRSKCNMDDRYVINVI